MLKKIKALFIPTLKYRALRKNVLTRWKAKINQSVLQEENVVMELGKARLSHSQNVVFVLHMNQFVSADNPLLSKDFRFRIPFDARLTAGNSKPL